MSRRGVFLVIIAILTAGHRWLLWGSALAFWFTRVVSRPLGASLADGLGKRTSLSGAVLGNVRGALALSQVGRRIWWQFWV